jgi:hypothetical protein
MKYLAAALLVMTACGSKKAPAGACIMEYDDVGAKGLACTVVTDAECKPDIQPSLDIATLARHSFTEGKTCADLGYKRSCNQVPIAWSFEKSCPL